MSTTDPHAHDAAATQSSDEPHGSTDHGGTHGHDDHAHGAEEEPLGPIDFTTWGLGVLGVLLGGVVAVLVAVSVGVI